jgi:DNA-binding protein YbaB
LIDSIFKQMKKAQEMAKVAAAAQKELSETVYTATDASGRVTAAFTGIGAPISIKIDDSILAQGSNAVSLAATEAMAAAHSKAVQSMAVKMSEIYGEMGLPTK